MVNSNYASTKLRQHEDRAMKAKQLEIEVFLNECIVDCTNVTTVSIYIDEWESMDESERQDYLSETIDWGYKVKDLQPDKKKRHKCTDDCSVKMPNISVGPGIMCS